MAARRNINTEQQKVMLQYMEEHEGLLKGKFDSPESEKLKETHWARLTGRLNSVGGGAVKDTKKWQRSWSDWKTDTKIKAGKSRRHAQGTGGGEPAPSLTEIEEKLMALIGWEGTTGLICVSDPLEEPASSAQWEEVEVPIIYCTDADSDGRSEPPKKIAKHSGIEENNENTEPQTTQPAATPRSGQSSQSPPTPCSGKKPREKGVLKSAVQQEQNLLQISVAGVKAAEISATVTSNLAAATERIAVALEKIAASQEKIEDHLLHILNNRND